MQDATSSPANGDERVGGDEAEKKEPRVQKVCETHKKFETLF